MWSGTQRLSKLLHSIVFILFEKFSLLVMICQIVCENDHFSLTLSCAIRLLRQIVRVVYNMSWNELALLRFCFVCDTRQTILKHLKQILQLLSINLPKLIFFEDLRSTRLVYFSLVFCHDLALLLNRSLPCLHRFYLCLVFTWINLFQTGVSTTDRYFKYNIVPKACITNHDPQATFAFSKLFVYSCDAHNKVFRCIDYRYHTVFGSF